MKNIFIKHRNKWLNDTGSWIYEEVLEGSIPEWKNHHISKYNWNPEYEGVEIEQIEQPPVEWLKKQIDESKDIISYYQDKIQRFENLLK